MQEFSNLASQASCWSNLLKYRLSHPKSTTLKPAIVFCGISLIITFVAGLPQTYPIATLANAPYLLTPQNQLLYKKYIFYKFFKEYQRISKNNL